MCSVSGRVPGTKKTSSPTSEPKPNHEDADPNLLGVVRPSRFGGRSGIKHIPGFLFI